MKKRKILELDGRNDECFTPAQYFMSELDYILLGSGTSFNWRAVEEGAMIREDLRGIGALRGEVWQVIINDC